MANEVTEVEKQRALASLDLKQKQAAKDEVLTAKRKSSKGKNRPVLSEKMEL